MRSDTQDAVRLLDRHAENGDSRQSVAEWYPVCAAIARFENADVGTRKERVRVRRIDRKRIDRSIGNAESGGCPCWRTAKQIGRFPDMLSGGNAKSVEANIRDIRICRIDRDTTDITGRDRARDVCHSGRTGGR